MNIKRLRDVGAKPCLLPAEQESRGLTFCFHFPSVYTEIIFPLIQSFSKNILWYISKGEFVMSQIAKLFINGRSQAVRLPIAYRFDTKEVFIRRDPKTGDVIISRKPANWDNFFNALRDARVPGDFLDAKERDHGSQDRDPFEGWTK